MRLALFLIICFGAAKAMAQSETNEFLFQKRKSGPQKRVYIGDQKSFSLGARVQAGKGKYEQTLNIDSTLFILQEFTGTKSFVLATANRETLATFTTKGKTSFDAKLQDGRVYTWERGKNSKEWKYVAESQEVLTGVFRKKSDGKKYILHTIPNSDIVGITTLELISIYYADKLIQRRANQPALFAMFSIVIIIRELAREDPTPEI